MRAVCVKFCHLVRAERDASVERYKNYVRLTEGLTLVTQVSRVARKINEANIERMAVQLAEVDKFYRELWLLCLRVVPIRIKGVLNNLMDES